MQDQNEVTNRAAFKIREFAAKFGHHPTWGYRQVYQGNVAVIDVMGQLMIPAHEVDRLLALAKRYDPKPKRKDGPKLSAQPKPATDQNERRQLS
jgi:hypothetical protein